MMTNLILSQIFDVTSQSWIVTAVVVGLVLLAVVGIIGSVVPALPGTPLNIIALLVTYFACPGEISLTALVVLLVAGVVVMIIDYVAPMWLTKVGGGSRYAIWGSAIGVVAGLFFMPLGLIAGPIAGALVGELIAGSSVEKSIKVSLWSFLSFLLTTGIKLLCGIVMTYYTLAALYAYFAA